MLSLSTIIIPPAVPRRRPMGTTRNSNIFRTLHAKGIATILLVVVGAADKTAPFASAVLSRDQQQRRSPPHPNKQQSQSQSQSQHHHDHTHGATATTATCSSSPESQTCDNPHLESCYDLCRADPSHHHRTLLLTTTTVIRGGHTTTNVMMAGAGETLLATTTTTPYGIPLTAWKIGFQMFLTLLNIVCWMIPLYRDDISTVTLSYLNAFSGGVFLTLAFCHLIPECAHDFHTDHHHSSSILPYAGVLFGYLLIFFVEKIAFGEVAHEMLQAAAVPAPHHHLNGDVTTATTKTTTTAAVVTNNHQPPNNNNKNKTTTAPLSTMTAANIAPGGGNGTTTTTGSKNSAVILLAALSVHSILEMMALGLARSFTDAAVLTGSIALHQPAESIALLVAFLKTGKSRQDILSFLSAFSIMGPIGVALGILVQEYAPSQFDTVVLAIVAGTFVYVGATEVIPEEFDDHNDDGTNKYKKFGCLMLGVAAILGITQYTMA